MSSTSLAVASSPLLEQSAMSPAATTSTFLGEWARRKRKAINGNDYNHYDDHDRRFVERPQEPSRLGASLLLVLSSAQGSLPEGEVRRIPIPRTPVNRVSSRWNRWQSGPMRRLSSS